jgi:hypothetical protein
MGLFDRVFVEPGELRSLDPELAEECRRVYYAEKQTRLGMSNKELGEYLWPRRAHLVDPYGDDGDTLH